MYNARNFLFETNSSFTHSLTYTNQNEKSVKKYIPDCKGIRFNKNVFKISIDGDRIWYQNRADFGMDIHHFQGYF